MRGEIEFALSCASGWRCSQACRRRSSTRSSRSDQPHAGARTLVATLRKNGAHTCLVSGGFTLFTGRIAAMIGFDENRANTLLLVPANG